LSGSFKTTSNKRQREQDQRERVQVREARRADRRARAAARAASGEVGRGPPIGEPQAPLGEIEARPEVVREGPPGRNAGARIYVGNLAFDTTAETVRALFSEQGTVTDVHFATDRDTGRPRGFAFVTMASPAEAEKAIRATDGRMVDGRALRVNEAEERSRGGGGGPRRGGGRF
jgi:RNA recognition motif-containing protein